MSCSLMENDCYIYTTYIDHTKHNGNASSEDPRTDWRYLTDVLPGPGSNSQQIFKFSLLPWPPDLRPG